MALIMKAFGPGLWEDGEMHTRDYGKLQGTLHTEGGILKVCVCVCVYGEYVCVFVCVLMSVRRVLSL